jgi:glycosyltransferase A (GT-A) superfamily protein (DUF2064 family)
MARAARRVLDTGESVLLIGGDCPALSAGHLRAAVTSLQHFDATLIPTTDGGYVLLGLKHFHASLFEYIEWSTDSVAVETLRRMEKLRWHVQTHSLLQDIDEPADLRCLPPDWLSFAPR